MKQYPSIRKEILRNQAYYVFDKHDGSNIRVKWTIKKGFELFGTRRRLLDESDPILGEAKPTFLNKYEAPLGKLLKEARIMRAQIYYEYWSPNSFAGFHVDEEHDATIFDIDIYKKGLLPPKEFITLIKGVDTAKLLYHGNITADLINSIRNGKLEGMTFEGVVCKGKPAKKGYPPTMFKIKNKAWLDKLKIKCGDDEAMFESLS